MKLLLIILITLPALANNRINIKLLNNKKMNYITVEKFYQEVQSLITSNDSKHFCKEIKNIYKELYSILDQDHLLIEHLRSFNNELYTSYSKHLNENAKTDIVKFFGYKRKCDRGETTPLTQFHNGLRSSFTNLTFLKMYHNQFTDSVQKR